MNFRRKLLAVFALTIFVSIAAVTLIVSAITRRAFEAANQEQTVALAAQFRREFDRRGEEVARRVSNIAASDGLTRMALGIGRVRASSGSIDYGAYLNEAKAISESQQLDFLEILDSDGTILSSAQWPVKFSYKEGFPISAALSMGAFLRSEELPEGVALSLSAASDVKVGDQALYVLGGRRVDKDFLASLELPVGMRALLYENLGGFSSGAGILIDPAGKLQHAAQLAPLIQRAQQTQHETGALIHWSSAPDDDEVFQAFPLTGVNGEIPGILLVGSSRRPYVGLRRRIRSAALLSAGGGILLAILFSGWAAARVTRPVDQLAVAARAVAAGRWDTQVPVTSSDELGELAESFNGMTRELLEQKERLLQAERVAAWRELARRLAHELKNPLFPLQLTIENLLRARQLPPEQFEEVFQESSSTLLAEISHLKEIISRFSEFSRMPQPHLEQVKVNELVLQVLRLFQAQLQSPERPAILSRLELAEGLEPISADSELLHRALSNLVLNAMDAMPQGGTLTLTTRQNSTHTWIVVADTGTGIAPEEFKRLFTPYFTSKVRGTGLGLAIVQSVVSDHGGLISVRSHVGDGTTFTIELPRRAHPVETSETIESDVSLT